MNKHEWIRALRIGFGLSILHRIILAAWMTTAWFLLGPSLGVRADHNLPQAKDPINATISPLPPLEPFWQEVMFGVWRRWDAFHYLYIAEYGYTPDKPYLSPFAPLVPLMMRFVSWMTPGPIDFAAWVYQTIAFGLMLTLLYQFCQDYYSDEKLGRWACVLTTLLPLSYYFQAPMTESTYVALALGMMLAAHHKKWWLVSLLIFLATLTRRQGVLLVGVAGLFLLDDWWCNRYAPPRYLRDIMRFSVVLLSPSAYFLHNYYLEWVVGYPSIFDVSVIHWQTTYVNPLRGIWMNYTRLLLKSPIELLYRPRAWSMVLVPLLTMWTLWHPKHRRLPLLGYTLSHTLLFISVITWLGKIGVSDGLANNFGRYAHYLFPLTIFAADRLRDMSGFVKIHIIALMFIALLAFSIWHVMLTGPS